MKFISILLLFLVILFTACQEENINNIKTKTAVVTGYLFAGQACDSIRITEATSYSSNDSLTVTLDDLNVTLDDGNQSYSLSPIGGGYYRNADLIIESGKTYTLQFEHNGKSVSAKTFVPEQRSFAISDTLIGMEKIEFSNGPPSGGFTAVDPIELSWDNPEGDYYYVVVQNIESNPEYVNEIFEEQDSLFSNFRFTTEPQIMDFYSIDPRREIEQFGRHRVILYRVNPEYASLYNVSDASTLSITEPPSNVENGLGILTGVASDTLYFRVKKL